MLNSCELINFGGKLVSLKEPIVMGIVNVTPDSFYAGSRSNDLTEIIKKVGKMIDDGTTIVDVGAFSSKPGAQLVSEEEEWSRLSVVLPQIRREFPDLFISLDTYRSEIVRRGFNEAGIQIVNDISGGEWDSQLFSIVANLGVAYVLMHIQGKPQTMQIAPQYSEVASEVIYSLSEKIETLRLMGICNIIIDPGFGFGKSLDHNYSLLKRLNDFQAFQLPVLAGVSRKSMIYKVIDVEPQDSLNGTTAVNMLALQQGVKILRVHDVKEAVECVKIYNQFNKTN